MLSLVGGTAQSDYVAGFRPVNWLNRDQSAATGRAGSRVEIACPPHQVAGVWEVVLRRGSQVTDRVVSELIPLLALLELMGCTEARPPWSRFIGEGDKRLSRRVRSGVREVVRRSRTGSAVVLVISEGNLS